MMLRIGTAGIPLVLKKRSSILGAEKVRELGLECMELEFVRGCNMSPETAKEVGRVAKKNNVTLTAHAPFYINLNSFDPEKLAASKRRILKSARIANIAGAISVTFHPAYYQKQDPKEVYLKVKIALMEIIAELKKDKNKIRLSLETTGKQGAFGTLDEILQLSKELDQIHPCVDFAHLWARNQGRIDFRTVLKKIKKELGPQELKHLHMHISGIQYTAKGERNHLTFEHSKFPYKELAKALKEFKVGGVVICESPNIEKDALIFQKLLK